MAINWNLTGCEGGADAFFIEAGVDGAGEQLWRLDPLTEALIFWLALHVGIGRVTEENVKEITVRLAMLEELYGCPVRYADGRQVHFTEAVVRRHIGLVVNATPRTKAQFHRTWATSMREAVLRKLHNAASVSVS